MKNLWDVWMSAPCKWLVWRRQNNQKQHASLSLHHPAELCAYLAFNPLRRWWDALCGFIKSWGTSSTAPSVCIYSPTILPVNTGVAAGRGESHSRCQCYCDPGSSGNTWKRLPSMLRSEWEAERGESDECLIVAEECWVLEMTARLAAVLRVVCVSETARVCASPSNVLLTDTD